MPKLFHFPLCPFSRRIRLALGEFDVEAELSEEKPWALSKGVTAFNPAPTLPVLVDDGGAHVCGVEAVSEYLDETVAGEGSKPSLIGRAPLERAEVRRLVAWFDVRFQREVTGKLLFEKVDRRFMTPQQGGGSPDMGAMRAGAASIRRHLDYIGELADARRWLAGDFLSYADLAAAAHLSCLDYLGDVPWGQAPAAKGWYTKIKSRPSFRPLLADQIRGVRPPRSYADLDF
ncbi:MAG: glutathione S-transferase family protein [Hyphomicrobiales bacterium]